MSQSYIKKLLDLMTAADFYFYTLLNKSSLNFEKGPTVVFRGRFSTALPLIFSNSVTTSA